MPSGFPQSTEVKQYVCTKQKKHECKFTHPKSSEVTFNSHGDPVLLTTYSLSPTSELECAAKTLTLTERAQTGSVWE